MRNWTLELGFHFPHDRFALGWEVIRPDKECKYYTFKWYLLILTVTFNTGSNDE
tara:strand:+ start:1455 stop:1616 length:162 start_codon:yes stop_codon:yes gene_type:complete